MKWLQVYAVAATGLLAASIGYGWNLTMRPKPSTAVTTEASPTEAAQSVLAMVTSASEPIETEPAAPEPTAPTLPDLAPEYLLFPTDGEIVETYSYAPVFSAVMDDWRSHGGIDIGAPAGAPVLCVADGIVERVSRSVLSGAVVELRHGGDMRTVSKSLSDAWVTEGMYVSRGATIGTVGSASEESDAGAHLHFELWRGEQRVDPEPYFVIR